MTCAAAVTIAGCSGFDSGREQTGADGIALGLSASAGGATIPPNPSFAEKPASCRMIRI
jgi:hypothetical protein